VTINNSNPAGSPSPIGVSSSGGGTTTIIP
jgi:hypothetical protein